jgi:transposase-like protein
MKTYPEELKSSIIKKLLPPINAYISELSKETGIPKDTLYAWRIKYRGQGQAPKGQQANSESGYIEVGIPGSVCSQSLKQLHQRTRQNCLNE